LDDRNLYNDKALLGQIAEGDQLAFSRMVRHYLPLIYRHLLIYIKNAHEAQELSQDIFMIIWKNREKLRNMDNRITILQPLYFLSLNLMLH